MLPGFGNQLSRAWALYRERLAGLLGLSLAGMAAMGLVVGGGMFLSGRALLLTGPWVRELILLGMGIGGLGAALVLAWISAAWARALSSPQPSAGAALSTAQGDVASMLWSLFLYSALIAGGALLLGLPGIIMAVWFTFFPFVLVEEGESGLEALARSREHARGHWWAIALRMAAVSAIPAAASFVPITGPLLAGVMAPFPLALSLILYRDLRADKPPAPAGATLKVCLVAVAVIGLGLGQAISAAALGLLSKKALNAISAGFKRQALQRPPQPEPEEPARANVPRPSETLYRELSRAYLSAAEGKPVTVVGLSNVTVGPQGGADVTYYVGDEPPKSGRYGFIDRGGGDWTVVPPAPPPPPAAPEKKTLNVSGKLLDKDFTPTEGTYIIVQSMSRVNLPLVQEDAATRERYSISIRIADGRKEVLAGQTIALTGENLIQAPGLKGLNYAKGCTGRVSFGTEDNGHLPGKLRLRCGPPLRVRISGDFVVPILWH